MSDGSDRGPENPFEDLRESALEATALLANGFLAGSDDLDAGDADRIREAAIRYLYRLLTLLAARSEEMDAIARRVASELDATEREPDFRASETTLWDRLDGLFERVSAGRAVGRASTDCESQEGERNATLPAYDGALFETDPSAGETAAFLRTHDVSDPTLARVVDALARRERRNGEKTFVDHSALPVGSLGIVYEDLLDRGLEVEGDEARLTTDAGGRAATGAYYTPEPLVEYAVERTLEPLLAEIRADIDWSDPDAAERFAREVRGLDVVDPAMGCGRFLLAAVEYLADAIADARRGRVEYAKSTSKTETETETDTETETNGDATAVEVARASLWLESIPAEDAPSLDHLKHGDSLVGASVGDIADLVDVIDSANTPASAASRRVAPTRRERLTAAANVQTAERLGMDVPREAVRRTRRAANDPSAWREVRDEEWFREVQSRADERGVFHWPLEFPAVFSGVVDTGISGADGGTFRANDGGFDAVLGNPPYVRSRNLSADRKAYLRNAYRTAGGAADLYVPFAELAGELASELGGRVSLVVPNKWTTTEYGRPLRDLLLDDYRLREILDASNLDAFPDADVYPVVVTFESGSPSDAADLRIRHPTEHRPLSAAPTTAVPRSLVDRLGGRVVPLEMDLAFATVVADALADCDRLDDHVEMSEGIHTGNVRGKLLADEPHETEFSDASRRKLVDGASIDRYRIDWDGSWIRYDESLVDRDRGEYADLRNPDLFEDEKLLVRDVSDRPVAAYDDEGYYALNTLYSVRSRADSELSLRYLLGVFNAEFAARYFQQVCGGTSVAGGYLRFKPMFVADLPVPDPDPDAVDPAAVAAAAGVEREIPDDPEAAVATLTERLRAATDERAELDADALDYLGDQLDSAGPTLDEWSRPASGVRSSILAETATDREGLRVGEVELGRDSGALSLSATARYKPETGSPTETDAWGFAETDPVTALRFPGLGPTKARLAEAFVPAAVERGEGFAGFRGRATKTISLLDRLRALALPDPEAAADDLRRYREARGRAEELDARIAAMEDALDGIVYRLYGLSEGEIAAMDRAD